MGNHDIYVTKPKLPPLEDYVGLLKQIWASGSLTNNGNFHKKLEQRISEYLDHEHISIQANGTLALWSALRALGCSGEIITTPFSFIATSHAIHLNNCEPVFVDIDPNGYNIDPEKIERAISEHTSTILGVHCYGHPAQVDKIEKLADKYNLKVVYDAAHAFGVRDKQGSILKYGDMSAVSFHATKVFSTIEGGLIVCKTKEQKEALDRLKNFGIEDELNSSSVGLNAKMSELHAAFGCLQLESLDATIHRRTQIANLYRNELLTTKGIEIYSAKGSIAENHSYFPVIVNTRSSLSRDELYAALKLDGIYTRRYFYPLITDQDAYKMIKNRDGLDNARSRSQQVLCLPIYADLTDKEVLRITHSIKKLLQ